MKNALRLVLLATLATPAAARADDLLKLDRFIGNPLPGVIIRDVAAGGRPWVIDRAVAKLDEDGRLKVDVRGLVFAPGQVAGGVPVGRTVGAIVQFAATLSCLDGAGAVHNVTTGGFDTTTTGDAEIRADIAVPAPCLAPVVLIRSFNPATQQAGNWFAVSGF